MSKATFGPVLGCLLLLSINGYCATQAAQATAACKSATTNAEMLNCQNLRYQKAQARLDAAYGKLLGKLDAEGKIKLQAAEAAWVVFRKANADFEADAARGGTMAPLIRTTVLADMTEARSATLEKSSRLQ